MALGDTSRAHSAGDAGATGGWLARLGGPRGIVLRLGLVGIAVLAASQHVMRQSSLLVMVGLLLAGLVLAAPLARYAAAWLVFSLVRGLADDVGFPDRGAFFAEMDRWIGLGLTPTERMQDFLYTAGQVGVVDSIAIWTHASYYVVPHAVAIGIWWVCRRNGMRLFETYVRAVVVVMVLGVMLYVLLPTSPPWLETNSQAGMEVTRIVHAANANPTVQQDQIYTVFTDPNPIAAMPSLHTAVTALAAWVLWLFDRRLGVVGVVYAGLMAFALVYLGEHYVVDILAGLVVAGVAVVVAGRMEPSPPAPLPKGEG